MKRIIVFLGTVCMLLIHEIALGAGLTVTVGNGSGSPGDTNIEVPINVSDVSGLGVISADIQLNYDATRLSFSSMTTSGTIAENWGSPIYNAGTAGQLKVALYGTTPISGQGKLVKIYFNVNTAAPSGTSNLSLIKARFNDGTTVTSTIQNGIFTVLSQNRPPVLDPIGDKQINEGATLIFNITATDLDGDNLTYSASNIPSNASFNSSTKIFTFNPGYNQAGTYQVTFSVSDGKGGSDSEEITITVNNVVRTYTLTINATNGSVTKNPNQASYNEGTSVTLTAVPVTGYSFVNWSGDLSGSTNPVTITMNSNKTITANFEVQPPVTHTITAIAGEGGTIEPSGDVIVNHGEDRVFTIQANPGYQIDDVLVDGNSVGAVASYTFTNVTGDHRIRAEFEAVEEPPVPTTPPSEHTTYPWNFDPDKYRDILYYYPIYGTAKVSGEDLSVGDWVGVFDKDGNCYGVGQYKLDEATSRYYYALSAYPALPDEGGEGFTEGERIFFKFYLVNTNKEIDATTSSLTVPTYPDVVGGDIDPVEINLVNVDTLNIPLRKGWNLISLNIQPTNPDVGEVLSSISDKVEYVTDHKSWWKKDISGSLTELNPARSYYVKADADCTLTVKGSRIELPYNITLDKGWNSISYPYDENGVAIGRTDNPSLYTGFLKDIINNIVWLKGADGWCTPEIDDISLEPNKGVFIKLKESCNLTLPVKDTN